MYGIDLFSGYGGITLALKGWVRPVMYCEIEEYAQQILQDSFGFTCLIKAGCSTYTLWHLLTTMWLDTRAKTYVSHRFFHPRADTFRTLCFFERDRVHTLGHRKCVNCWALIFAEYLSVFVRIPSAHTFRICVMHNVALVCLVCLVSLMAKFVLLLSLHVTRS